MPFPSSVVQAAWLRAAGHCECPRVTHDHGRTKCNKQLVWNNRGREGRGAWEANHRVRVESGGSDTLSNCEILCWNPCHRSTI